MKYTIASLIACLSANEANAQWGYGGHWSHGRTEKYARCHYTEDMSDWSKARMMFDLNQRGSDAMPYSFRIKM